MRLNYTMADTNTIFSAVERLGNVLKRNRGKIGGIENLL